MLHGAALGAGLELRAESDGGFRLSGAFPYAPRPSWSPAGSSCSRPRHSRAVSRRAATFTCCRATSSTGRLRLGAGSLDIRDTPEALFIEARIEGGTSWASDFLAAHKAGLIRGLSPGFRVPDGGERIERRGNGLLRRITRAELFEVSTVVTRPAFEAAQVEARSWTANVAKRPQRFSPPETLEALTWA